MSECNHNCADCASKKEGKCNGEHDFRAPMNDRSNVKRVIAVMSGKGGVGKSLVTELLAVEASRRGLKTAILDADITGPSIPKIFGIKGKAQGIPEGLVPSESKKGIKVMSSNLLLENDTTDVSMEIGVYDFKFLNDGVIDILDYEYEGVTVIGCDPAMVGAKIQMSFSKNNNKEYIERVKELDELLANFSLLKGGEDVENNMEQSQENLIEEPQVQEFAEEEKEEDVCPECGKNPCECEEEKEEEEFQQEVEVEEPQEEKLYSQSEMDEVIANTKAEFSQVLEELEELRKFKAEYDKALEVQKMNDEIDNLVSQFNCDEELVKELREKVLNKEITMENFELQLWRNNQVSKKEFNNKEKQSNKLPVIDNENKVSNVDALFDYYGIPKRK